MEENWLQIYSPFPVGIRQNLTSLCPNRELPIRHCSHLSNRLAGKMLEEISWVTGLCLAVGKSRALGWVGPV